MTFLTNLGVTEVLCSFKLVLEGKTGKEIPVSSRLGFLQKFSAHNFALSDAEDNTFGPLNRGGIADLLLLRTLLAICQKSQEASFWEVMDSFHTLNFKEAKVQMSLILKRSNSSFFTLRKRKRMFSFQVNFIILSIKVWFCC